MSSVLRRTHFLYQNVLRLRIQVLFVRNDRLIYIKGNGESLSTFSVVPRPGIEPGWVAPLVFETSASTDSAIWAIVCFSIASAKVMLFFISAKKIAFFLKKVINTCILQRKEVILQADYYQPILWVSDALGL